MVANIHSIPLPKPVSEKKLEKRLRRLTAEAIVDFEMIEEGDRVMVCVSGGKDSYTMLDMLISLRAAAPVSFDLCAVNLDQNQPGFPKQVLPDYLSKLEVPFHVLDQDTYSVVKRVIPEGKTMCGLCSRLRRGALYRYARENGFSKIALGHHRDDIIETLFLNMFNGGKMATMPPKLRSDDGTCVVIRPLSYCSEGDIAKFARMQSYPIIPCKLCGTQEKSSRRQVKAMLGDWRQKHPGRLDSIFKSMTNVSRSHLLDKDLYDFSSFEPGPGISRGDQ